MRSRLLTIVSSIALTGLLLSLPLSGSAESGREFPYHIDKTVEKQRTYDHGFDDIWNATLILIKEKGNIQAGALREAGMESVNTAIKSDKSSGMITLSLTHKGKKGFLSSDKSLFLSYVLLLDPLEKQRTTVYFHEINFISYDSYVFDVKQRARYIDFTPSETHILKDIQTRLEERSVETQ